MKYGLTERSIETIKQIFKKYSSIEKAVLYGSRAKGNFKNGSDIDVTLFTTDFFSHTDLLHILDDFDNSTLPYFVDVSNYKTLQNSDLIEHINRVGKILYKRASCKTARMGNKVEEIGKI